MGKYIMGILPVAFIVFVFLHTPEPEFPYKELTDEEIKCVTVSSSVVDYVMTSLEVEKLVGILNDLSHYGYAGAYEVEEESGRHLAAVHQEYVSMRYEMSGERPYKHLDIEMIKEILEARYYGSSADADVMFVVEYTDGRKEYIWVIEPWYFVVNGAAYEIEVEIMEQIEHLNYVD